MFFREEITEEYGIFEEKEASLRKYYDVRIYN